MKIRRYRPQWLWRRYVDRCVQRGIMAILDWQTDTWTIRGVKISDNLIQGWAEGGWPIGEVTKLIKREDGILTFERLRP